jgi:hypothetical protein
LLELLQDLLPYLAAFYLLDSLVVVDAKAAAFGRRGRRFAALPPGLHVFGLLPSDESIVVQVGAGAMEADRARAVRQRQLDHSPAVHGCGWLMLAGLGVAIPLQAFGRWETDIDLGRQCAALLVPWGIVVALCWTQLRVAGLRGGKLASALAGLVFFPPAAAHASCLLGRHLYAGLHPLVVAWVVLDRERFDQLARRYHYESPVRADELARVLGVLGLTLEDVLRHPRSSDPTAAGYCPICAVEYRAGYGTCSDCRGPLLPLAA